jgi:hypothetical protein
LGGERRQLGKGHTRTLLDSRQLTKNRVRIILRTDEQDPPLAKRFRESPYKLHIHPPIDQPPKQNRLLLLSPALGERG